MTLFFVLRSRWLLVALLIPSCPPSAICLNWAEAGCAGLVHVVSVQP